MKLKQQLFIKYFLTLTIILCGCIVAIGQSAYWQQQVNYEIKVSLQDETNSLDAFETITYYNNSPDTLYFIWFHLWNNAYKNDHTAFAEQTLRNGSTAFYFSDEDKKGYINKLDFKVNAIAAITEAHPKHIDIIKLILPKPLPPKQSAIISTPFHVQLPYNFSRGGHVGDNYQVTQWYPKPAVYDSKGWHEMPYLDQGEFYSEFGNYNVQITVPENYTVAASGVLQNNEILDQLKKEGKKKISEQLAFKEYMDKVKLKKKLEPFLSDTIKIKSSTAIKTLEYQLQNAHDFAWFASKLFVVGYDSVTINENKIDIFTYYFPWNTDWNNAINYAKDGLKFYSEKIGTYPYSTASIVAGSFNINSGGMEYPSITLITTADKGQMLDATIVHELGHNWFYGALASNERDHPWMDEGMNTYYQKRYEATKYQNNTLGDDMPKFIAKRVTTDIESLMDKTFSLLQKSQPIDTVSEAYTSTSYGLIVYSKASQWMQKLENELGKKNFDSCIKKYYQEWKFKHPYPNDFKVSIEKSSGKNLADRFQQLQSTEPLDSIQKERKKKVISFFSLKETNKYNYTSITPVIGYNRYDKLILGAAVHNYQLPLNKLQFFVAPAYAIGSRQLNYTGRVSYNSYQKKSWLAIALSTSKYTMNDFQPENGDKIFQNVQRIVPSIQYTIYRKDAASTHRLILRARSFFLKEDGLEFKTTNINGSPQTIVNKTPVNTNINQISITSMDNRILYPYQMKLSIDQGKDFIRAGFTGNYFFNYSKTKGGIDARFFAGKFIYTTGKTFIKAYETDRYQLNMTGGKGYEDYTYSNYFIGRNEFEGWQSQQIMNSDGFFKVRTDLLSNKIGKTDNWLMALNFSGNIPDKYNILNVLPIKIPLHFFVDIGTTADAWKENPATGKFLYDAGLQIPLLKSLVNIYVPILYSKVYSNYFKSTLGENRFWKTISFSIDVQKLQFNKLSREIPL
jgi:hypothetical protein